MIRQEVIVHKLFIDRFRQVVAFQVRLPKDTSRIIGLEYNARKIYYEPEGSILREAPAPEGDNSFLLMPNKTIGQLSLGNFNCAGLFYQGDLIENRNAEHLERIASLQYTASPWIQSTKSEEICFCVTGNTIEALFKDTYGVEEYEYLEYELSLYFWIEKCINDD